MTVVMTDSTKVIKEALHEACETLSLIVSYRFQPDGIDVSYHDPMELPDLWREYKQTPGYAVCFQVNEGLAGYLLLVFPFADTDTVIRLLSGFDGGDDELATSALGEVGNIIGDTFLSCLAGHFRTSTTPTPQFVGRTVGEVWETYADSAKAEEKLSVPFIRTTFTQKGEAVSAFLVWIPDSSNSQTWRVPDERGVVRR